MGAGYDRIKCGDLKLGMRHVKDYDLHIYVGQGLNTVFHFHPDVVV